jgi:amino acid transporter
MNFDRYLATSYPIFHRTSVTKRRLFTLLAILNILGVILIAMSSNDFVISYQVHMLIFCILLIPAMLFINYKLFQVVRKSRRNKRISPDMKKTFSLKNISSCLLVVACVVVVCIPECVYIGLRINSPETKNTLDNANVAGFWAITISLMNCTFNCLIFYWKNKVLRTEGLKVLKSMKICRRVQS